MCFETFHNLRPNATSMCSPNSSTAHSTYSRKFGVMEKRVLDDIPVEIFVNCKTEDEIKKMK